METFPLELDNALFAFNLFQYIPIDKGTGYQIAQK
jgi:hypothetical protein